MEKGLLLGLALMLFTMGNTPPEPASLSARNSQTVKISDVEYKDGLYLYKKKVFNGNIVEYYENEKLKYKCKVFDGRLHGETIQYFPEGQIKAKRNYYLGKLHGSFSEYFSNGKLRIQGTIKENNYHGGENVTNLVINTMRKGKLRSKKYDKARVIFVSEKGEHYKSSEELPIYKQEHFILTSEDGEKTLLESK